MTLLLSSFPLWLSCLLLVGLTTALAMCIPVVVRRSVGLERLAANNEVAGFKFATVGVIYAVLLAFAVIVVWEKFSDAEKAVAQEAGAAVTLYRLSYGVEASAGPKLRGALTTYLEAAIDQDWPAMAREGASPTVTHALDSVYLTVETFDPREGRETAILSEILQQLDTITQARRTRIVLAAGVVPGVVWLVLFGGAILTIGFTFFFGTESLRAQILMTGLLSTIIFLGLFVIIAIDHPFTGPVSVTPDALSLVLEDFGKGA